MDKELNSIKQQAFDNVSEKLTVFEDGFAAELTKRSAEVGYQITDWQANLEKRLTESSDAYAEEWQQTEERIAADQRGNIAALGERLTADLERLKKEASAFEEGIRAEMSNADEARLSFAEQINKDLAEIRSVADDEVKAQIGKHHLALQETLRQKQRELEAGLEDLAARTEAVYTTLDSAANNSRQTFDEWQSQYNTRMRDMDMSLEELRRHSRETAAENDERVAQFRSGLDDIRKEIGVQKKVFDRTVELKQELEHQMEEINGNLDRLDQRKAEIARFETQLTRIKRLEDEVKAKEDHFNTEKHRIEVMEENFTRLLKTSQAVEEKLKDVSSSDDILQNVQLQIRKLEDSLKETEEKFERIERKKEILEETNEGIDRNFKALQTTEAAIKQADEVITALSDQFEDLSVSIKTLAGENEKAVEAVEKTVALDETLVHIEKRIAEMDVARNWVARAQTELQALDKHIRSQLNLTRTLLDREGAKNAGTKDKGAPPPQSRDNVKRLKLSGWTNDEIATSLGISKGEVELILELDSRT
jgi:chromosome segregation ATPase